jgi:phosphoadenosine phosphosulfate reductase
MSPHPTGGTLLRPPGRFLHDAELAALDACFEHVPADDIIRWAVATFGDDLCLTASMADALLIDIATRVAPGIEVVFLDTQYHFPETLETLRRVERRYDLNLVVLRPDVEPDERWRTDTDACCAARKVAPLDRHLATKRAWMSGLRRADHPDRADTPIVGRDRRGLVKINPIATWTDEQADAHVAEHDVVVNPLLFDGYGSVGCWPCTRRTGEGEHARAGRWAGTGKTECGLHL